MKLVVAIPLAFVLTATVHVHAEPPKKPVVNEMMPAQDVTRWLVFFDRLVTTVVSDETNCDKMANDVSHVIDDNRPAIEVARQAREARKKLPVAAQEKMLDGVKRMAPGIQKCGEKDNVKAAFAKLDVSRRG
jgi:hypothetical protein